jgi:hypothetical protein
VSGAAIVKRRDANQRRGAAAKSAVNGASERGIYHRNDVFTAEKRMMRLPNPGRLASPACGLI